jgi:hypothetical protein
MVETGAENTPVDEALAADVADEREVATGFSFMGC